MDALSERLGTATGVTSIKGDFNPDGVENPNNLDDDIIADIATAREALKTALKASVDEIENALSLAASSQDSKLYDSATKLIMAVGDLSKKLSEVAVGKVKPMIPLTPAPDGKKGQLSLPAPDEEDLSVNMTTEQFMKKCEQVTDVEFEEVYD